MFAPLTAMRTRDYSAAANQAFERPVPKELLDYLKQHKDTLLPEFREVWDAAGSKTSGDWRDVFGPGNATDDILDRKSRRVLFRSGLSQAAQGHTASGVSRSLGRRRLKDVRRLERCIWPR